MQKIKLHELLEKGEEFTGSYFIKAIVAFLLVILFIGGILYIVDICGMLYS